MGNSLDELKSLLNQKTVTTKRLAPLVLAVEKMYIQSSNVITKKSKKAQGLHKEIEDLKKINAELAIRLATKMMDEEQRKRLLKKRG